jgi:LPS export ABC transporter protein LptC
VLADKGILSTDQTVTISEGGSTLSGVGMVIDKSRQQFTLRSQVKGTFDAPTKK